MDNLNRAQFLLDEPATTNTYMDGYNVGFS